MLKIVIVVLAVCLFPLTASSIGSPGFLPDGPHPRIWLTQSELSDLKDRLRTKDPRWVALESWCDTNLETIGYESGDSRWIGGYRYSKQKQFIINYSLAYQLLKGINPEKAAAYAAYARNIIIDLINGQSVGEEINGLMAIRLGEIADRTINKFEASVTGIDTANGKLGYTARNLMCVALGYDWLYETLSPDDRTKIRDTLLRWVDWQRGKRTKYNNGVLIGGIRYYEDTDGSCDSTNNCTDSSISSQDAYGYLDVYDNFNSGEMLLAFVSVLSTYGDFDESLEYFNYIKSDLFETSLKKTLNNSMGRQGGDSVEGWSYGSGYWFLFEAMYALKTATGQDIFDGFEYPTEVLRALPHRLMGDMKSVPVWGRWNANPVGEIRIDVIAQLVGMGRRILGNTDDVQVGQYLIDNYSYSGHTTEWQNFMYLQSGHPTVPPSSLPLSFRAVGDGLVCSRDSWSPSSSLITVRLDGRTLSSKESYDDGTITLGRGSDRLIVHENLAVSSQSNNTIIFNETNHRAYDYGYLLRSSPCIDRYEVKTRYSYTSGDITASWMYKYGDDYAKLFRRTVLHLRPGLFVIYDVTQSEPSRGNLKGWYTNYIVEPTIDKDIIAVAVGSSKGFVKTLFPTGGTYTKTTPSAGYWRVKYEPKYKTEYNQFLHVIEATASSQAEMRSSSIIVSRNRKMRGLNIINSINGNSNWTVLFSTDENANDVDGDISFIVNVPEGVLPENYNQSLMLCNIPVDIEYTYIPPQDRSTTSHEFLLKRGADMVSDSSTKYYNVKSSAQGLLYFQDAYDPNASCIIQDLKQVLN